jgi:hypothetical protein
VGANQHCGLLLVKIDCCKSDCGADHVPGSLGMTSRHQNCGFFNSHIKRATLLCELGIMPYASTFFWAAYPIILLAFVYQVGLPSFIVRPITDSNAYNTLWKLFSTTHCYGSVTTLTSEFPYAQCFSVSNGKFSRVFRDDNINSRQEIERPRAGHVVPGLWDGHGHLVQYGELLDSVSLFGAVSMQDVQKRLVEYKIQRPETGTRQQWLRGVGWDQANFNGQWPIAVGLPAGIDHSMAK